MEHLIQLLDVLVWPSVVLFVIFVFRGSLQELFSFIEKIKYKDFEVSFHNRLKKIPEEVGFDLENLPEGDVRFVKLLEASPSAAVMEAWIDIESAARKKVQELAPTKTTFRNILQRPVLYLEHIGALTPSTAKALRELQALRNDVAHTRDRELSKEDALSYISISAAMLKKIESITDLPKIKLTALTTLIFELNSLIDSGKFKHVTIDDVYAVIRDKRIIPFLDELTNGHGTIGFFQGDGPYSSFVDYYHDRMEQMHNAYSGNHRRKWGVENFGLCLLLAWTNELVQQGSGWYPSD
jgi:hypothetical protein